MIDEKELIEEVLNLEFYEEADVQMVLGLIKALANRKPKTNYEKIKAMSVDEMADVEYRCQYFEKRDENDN